MSDTATRRSRREARRKILTGNAARVYGIDVDALATAAATDDLSWTNAVAAELGS